MLTRLTYHGFTHQPTRGYLASDIDTVMPGPHLVSSLLKRWTAGTGGRYACGRPVRPGLERAQIGAELGVHWSTVSQQL